MATSYTGLRVQDTYNAIIKIGDNSNLTATPKLLSDGLGNDSPLYLSGTRLGIGISPAYQFHTSGNAKIGGDVIISGDLTVNGDLTYLNVTDLAVEDPLIKLAKDNASNTLDIGFFGKYVESSTTKYTGLFWDASTDKFRLFEGLQDEPTTTVDPTGTGYTRSLLNANLEGNVTGTVSSLSNHDTNDLVEGSVNLYFTTNRARASFSAGTGVTITNGEIAIGQDVATDSNVTFGDITGSAISGTTGTFSSNTSITGDTTTPHSDNAFIVYRGSDGSTALRVQNSGEVVVQNNYLYASGAGTSLYVQNGAVIRGNISNDGGNVSVADNLDVTGNVDVDGNVNIEGGQLKIEGDFAKLLFVDTAGTDEDAYIVNNANGLFFGKTNTPSASNDIFSLNLSTSIATFAGQVIIPETPTADAHAASKKYVDDNTGTSDVAKRLEVTVKNVSGGSLSKGTVVHAAPTTDPPQGNVIEVIAADANDAAKMPAIGVLNETIADEVEGEAVMFGAVSGIDTSGFSVGDELYVSETAGEFTATKPTAFASQVQKIAVVIKSSANNGLIKVFGAGRANDVPNRVDRSMNFTDSSTLSLGTGEDLFLIHDATNSIIGNSTGNLIIRNDADDSDIIFQSDDGSGGRDNYLTIDGGVGRIFVHKLMRFDDDVQLRLGDNNDIRLYHNSTSGNGNIENHNGSLYITNYADDEDIIFRNDNGSGDVIEYFRLDGSTNIILFGRSPQLADNVKLYFGNSTADDASIKWDSTASQLFIDGSSKFLNDLSVVGNINANSGIVHLTSDAPILKATSNNNASGFRIQVNGLDGDNDDLFRVQDVGTTKFNLKRDGDVANDWIPFNNSSYNLGSSNQRWLNVYADNVYADNFYGTGTFHPLSLVSKVYNSTNTSSSISGGTSLDEEYELLEFGESASPVYLNLKSAAHSSASFVITRGYFGNNTASIQCTGSTYTANGGYPNVRGIRVIKDNNNAYKVIIRLYRSGSHSSFSLYARAWGGNADADINFSSTLTDTFTETTALGGITDLSVSTSLSAAYSRDTLYADNALAAFGNNKDLQIYHDGSHSYIQDSGTGRLIIKSDYFEVDNAAGNEAMLEAIQDGAVNLYYNGSKKFETTSTGISVNGQVVLSGDTEHYIEKDTTSLITAAAVETTTVSGRNIDLYAYDDINLRAGTGDSITMHAGGSERVRINSSGNVGISTTSPSTKLHVNSVNAEASLTISRDGNNIVSGQGVGSIVFPADYNGTPTNYGKIVTYANALSSVRGSIDFKVKSTSGNLLTGLTVYGTFSGVNVGIGTSSPSYKLDVQVSGNVARFGDGTRFFRVYTDADEVSLLADGSVPMKFYTSGTERMRIDSSGRVGIGTTSPTYKFEVSNGTQTGTFNPNSSGFMFLGSTSNHSLYFGVNDSTKMVINTSGNVGIGTTNPTRDLTIGDGSGNSVLAIVAATNGLSQIGLGDSDDDNYGQIILRHSDGLLQIQNGGGGGITERGLNITSSEDIGMEQLRLLLNCKLREVIFG